MTDATLTLSDVAVTGIACGLAAGCPAPLARVGPAARFEAEDLRVRDVRLSLGSAGAARGLIYGDAGAVIRLRGAELSGLRLRATGTLSGGLLPCAPEGSVELTAVSLVDSELTGDEAAYGALGGARDLSWTEVSAQRLDFVFGTTVYLAVTQGGSGSTISHSDLRAVRVSGGTHTVGVYVNAGALTIENSRFADVGMEGSGGVGYGLLVSDNARINLNYVTLVGNTVSNGSADTAGLSCRNRSTCGVDNSSFAWNDASAVLRSAAGAMSADASSALTARYAHLWGNTGAYGETVNLATGGPIAIAEAVLAEPNFMDLESRPSDWDLRLNPRSALIDAGDPAALDADGSRADIGSYGGPNGR